MNFSVAVILTALIQYAILLSLFIALRAALNWHKWRKFRASMCVTQAMLEIASKNHEREMQGKIRDNLEEIAKEMKLWFIYRYPNGHSCEVHTLDGWAIVDSDYEVSPMWFVEEPDENELDSDKFEGARIGQFAQFYEICEQVEKLEKWKQSNR